MSKVARILDINSNKIIGKLYKEQDSLVARPDVEGDKHLPLVYYYKGKLHDKLEIAMELGVIDDIEIDSKLLKDIEDIFDTRYEICTIK